MIKTLFAIAFLSGSISVFADDMYNDSSTYPEHYKSGSTSSSDRYQYSDTTSSSMSSTSTTENLNPESTVTGTMAPEKRMADEYQKLHVGFLSGINAPAGTDVSNSVEWGGEVGYQPTNNFGLGVEATTTKLDRSDKVQRTMAFLKGTARLGGDTPFLKDIYVGGAGGPVISNSKVRIGGGPLAGFDIPLASRSHDYLSLGLNAKYVFTKDTPDSLISAVALKYWF